MNQLRFFSHLRYLMILFVVVFHVSISYSHLVPWWFVHDVVTDSGFDLLILYFDVFMMPVLFFIAGYFAIPSIERKGAAVFIKDKFKRLGIPFLLGVTFLCPTMPYLKKFMFTAEGMTVGNFLEFWLMYIKSAGDFHIGIMTSRDSFDHYHLWFISVLLLFFVIFCGLYTVGKKRFFPAPFDDEYGNGNSMPKLKELMLFGALTSIGYFAVIRFHPDRHWLNIFNIIIFQPGRMVFYVAYFILGAYGYSKKWFLNGNTIRFLPLWIFLCLLSGIGILLTINGAVTRQSTAIVLTYSFIRSFLCLSIMAILISFSSRFWNQPSKINTVLSASSYNVYLFHLPIVVGFQFALINWKPDIAGVVWIKFGLVAILATALSFAASVIVKRFNYFMEVKK